SGHRPFARLPRRSTNAPEDPMRVPGLGLLSLLLAATVSPTTPRDEAVPAGRSEPPPAPPPAPRAEAPAPAPAPMPAIHEIGGPLPKGLAFDLRPGDEGLSVRAKHPKHLVALRGGGRRAAAATEASLHVEPGLSEVVWETTDLASLATSRGV